MKICKECSEPFEPKNGQMLFCKKICKNSWHAARRNARLTTTCRHADGCPRMARKAGWCDLHYQRIRVHGDPGPAHKLSTVGDYPNPDCSIDGCIEPRRALGMCARHYKRVQSGGDVGPAGRLRRVLPVEVRNYTKGQLHRFHRYGLTVEAFEALLARQGGRCYICKTSKPGRKGWSVDHCHDTNVVRFIACNPCNVALGLIKEDPVVAKRLYEVAVECQQLRVTA